MATLGLGSLHPSDMNASNPSEVGMAAATLRRADTAERQLGTLEAEGPGPGAGGSSRRSGLVPERVPSATIQWTAGSSSRMGYLLWMGGAAPQVPSGRAAGQNSTSGRMTRVTRRPQAFEVVPMPDKVPEVR